MGTNDTKEIAPQAATSEAKIATLIQVREKYRGNSKADQGTRLLEALRLLPVSTFEARRFLDVMHPAGRVQELRDTGHAIDTLRITEPSEVGRPHCIAVYVFRQEAGL